MTSMAELIQWLADPVNMLIVGLSGWAVLLFFARPEDE